MPYKNSINLPKTSFSLRKKHQNVDPKLLNDWKSIDIYSKMIDFRNGSEEFVLHDGPPYANGHIHIGHALNKILKDSTNKFQHNLGKKINYTTGWDCHGLPIEWKVEEQYRKNKKDKDANVLEFREDCRQYAQKWVDIQKEEFKELGVFANWDNSYETKSFKAEAEIVNQFHKMVLDGRLFEDVRPVMWSPVEQTSLAEAEVEYKVIKSLTADVLFPVAGTENEFVVIWTTTPWTIPANKALAANPDILYSKVSEGERFLWMASDTVESNMKKWGYLEYVVIAEVLGKELNTNLLHPLEGFGERTLLMADFVTSDTGTGFVHIAPAHGEDDFTLGMLHNLDTKTKVMDNGVFEDNVPVVGGMHVYKAGKVVIEALEEKGLLQAKYSIEHEYPHSWRSKKPIIYRTTPQWFISLEHDNLREKALEVIKQKKWIPSSGEKRISNMVESRASWCVSRQRTWGAPLMIFVNKKTRKPLLDKTIFAKLQTLVETDGCDAWFTSSVNDFLEGTEYNPDDYDMVMDVLDVWFDSGTTWAFTLEGKQADLYLEGSDQNRGWFQSSLLVGTANTGDAPYNTVLTHGFVLDHKGRKMSKSEGNVIAPEAVVNKYGIDVLRLWALTSDYTSDLRIGDTVLEQSAQQASKLRNTMRYCLSNLKDNEIQPTKPENFSSLELFVLNRLARHDEVIKEYANQFNYHKVVQEVTAFANFLSNFYFDVRKDRLYCGSEEERNETLWVLERVYKWLVGWLSPILSYTCQEAWNVRGYNTDSPFLMNLITDEQSNELMVYKNDDLEDTWNKILDLRNQVNTKLETYKKDGFIKSNLEAKITVSDLYNVSGDVNYKEIFIVAEVNFGNVTKETIQVEKSEGIKCPRCWNFHEDSEELCNRCSSVL
jgi:isoleucyl-tRNA synthetase